MPTVINNYQESLVLNELIAMTGVFPPRDGDVGSFMTMGMIRTVSFNFELQYGQAADGQVLSISQNTALFSLLGTNYGGNGQTTFELPDLQRSTAIGRGGEYIIGQATGTADIALTQGQLPEDFGGSGTPVDNLQPSLPITYLIRTGGNFGQAMGGTGQVVKFAGNFPIAGFLECAGQTLQIADYENLFTLIGTTYGGDGVQTFRLPDLRGLNVVGATTANPLGTVVGHADLPLDDTSMPLDMEGGGQPVDNQAPGLAMNYVIALQGVFPSRDGGSLPDDQAILGEITILASNNIPNGWLRCEGQLLSIAQNQALFSLLGTTYGGDGRTTFALPDLRGRTTIGAGNEVHVGEVIGHNSESVSSLDIPDLVIAGTAGPDRHFGGGGNDTLYGEGGADALFGNAGDDILQGGSGVDIMQGGAGGDTYFVDMSGDSVIEAAGGGSDRVISAVSYTLTAGSAVELLQTNNQAATTAINFVGNEFAQSLVGNSGANILNGMGGFDILRGLGGNDTYYVDAYADQIQEVAGGGMLDRVLVSTTFNLAADDDIEYMGTTNEAGTAAINLVGNGLNQILVGNAGINVINGGAGADDMRGLGGNDFYYVDNALDTIQEAVGQGTLDRVLSTISFTLAADDNIEYLATTSEAGTNAIDLTGNSIAQIIVGNSGANVINGGLGNDTLRGLGGADFFVFNTAPGASNVDTLSDFTSADTIRLENAIFTGLVGVGTLTAAQFVSNTTGAAANANQHIIYETDTGNLYYDSNGSAAGGSVLFAHLSPGLALTSADFVVI